MTTNYIRPTISYENVSLLKGSSPSHSEDSNNDQTINLIPLVQDFNFSFNSRTEDILTLSEKFYAKRLNTYDVDVNLTVTAFETFENLFSGFFSGTEILDDFNKDCSFYFALSKEKYFSNFVGELDTINFGNAFISDFNLSQSTKQFLTSKYTYTCSNVNADILSLERPYKYYTLEGGNLETAIPYYNTSITQETIDGSTSIQINDVPSTPTGQTFALAANRFIFGSSPIHLHKNGKDSKVLPFSLSGKTFGYKNSRNEPHTIFVLSLEDGANINLYQDGDGINGSSVSGLILNSGETGQFVQASSNVFNFLHSNKNIIASKFGNSNNDQIVLAPAEEHVYRRSGTFESSIINTAPTVSTTHYVSHASGVVTSAQGDGAGTDSEGGIGLSKLTTFQSWGSKLRDYQIVAPYANTVTKVYYFSGSDYHLLENGTHSLNGTITNPASVFKNGDGTSDNAGAGSFFNDMTLWKFESTNPVGVFVNDNSEDEDVLVGWNSTEVKNPAINLSGDQSQNLISRLPNIQSLLNGQSNLQNEVYPSHKTNISISGIQNSGLFLIDPDIVENFSLNLPFERRKIFQIGKRYPITRKFLDNTEGSLSMSIITSEFELTGTSSNLKDFINLNDKYVLNLSFTSEGGSSNNFQISGARLNSNSQSISLTSRLNSDVSFNFNVYDFKRV